MTRSLWCAAMVGCLAACGPNESLPPVPAPTVSTAVAKPAEVLAGGLARTAIDSVADYDALAYRDGGLLTPGRSVKFLIDYRDPSAPRLAFMNSNFTDPDGKRPDAARYHFYFGERVLADFAETRETFTASTYDTLDKRFIAGAIQTYYVDGAREPLYGIQFWPEDIIRGATIVKALRIVRPLFRVKGAKVGFVATGAQQQLGEAAAELAELGIKAYTLDEVLGSVDYIPLNKGEAWGTLRLFPKDPDDLSASDIPVFEELPLDLTVVAGTITKAYQDPTSHVNLKSKERGTPNMVLRSAGPTQASLAPFVDKPVHLVVDIEGYRLEAATEAEVKAKLAEKLNRPWTTLPYEPTDALRSYAEMCPHNARDCFALTRQYGSKAAMLGFLTSASVLGRTTDAGSLSAKYGYDLVPAGLGVPFKFYDDFLAHPPNAALREKLAALVEQEKKGTLSPKARRALVDEVQALFYAAQLPNGMVDAIERRLAEVLPGVEKIKVRSSANAEDMVNFDGAGLYSSFSATLTKKDKPDGSCRVEVDGVKLEVKPKTLACALKGAFASVWNKRAVEERSFARLDHATARMGIAIVPKYDLESPIAANSVVVTRVINSQNVYGYTFATQVKNGLVTNPEPGTLAENVIAAFTQPREAASFVVTRHATPVAGKPPIKKTVLSEAQLRQMHEITRHVEEQYCQSRSGYYPYDCRYAPADPDKERALDFELKLLENGHFICKQVREFTGR
jgi:pyruvate,water dikinase